MVWLTSLFVALLFQTAAGEPNPECVVGEDELHVYNAALSHLSRNELDVLVLEDQTGANRTVQGTDIYRDLYPLWVAYLKANEVSCNVKFSLEASYKRVILSHEAIEAYFVGEEGYSWKHFRADFSERSAYARVSRVGFGNNGQKALLYVEYRRGNLAGKGAYLLVENSHDGWRVTRVWVTWES